MIGSAQAAILGISKAPKTWDLTVTTTGSSQTYTVDINAGTSPSITVDWGDGSAADLYTSTGQKTHTYTNAGTYAVKISGSFASGGNIRLGSNATNRARLKATKAAPYIPGLLNFNDTFTYCTGITSVPADLFRYNPQVSTLAFKGTFYGTILTEIPANLFRYNTLASTDGFYSTFGECPGITSIPSDLFRYNLLVSGAGFYATFYLCTGLTGSLPADLFRYNTLVTENAFRLCFYGCHKITSVPADFFRYNTLVSGEGFRDVFYGCTAVASIPADLFRYNTASTSFYRAFYGCNKLQLRSDIFFAAGEEGTRFLNKTVTFAECFRLTGAFTGTQGTAPALWSCDFGSGAATKTDCFQGHDASSLSNWADIPAAWT